MLEEGVETLIINDEEKEETNDLETPIMIEANIQEFKARMTMY
jgi:hypothetical protein